MVVTDEDDGQKDITALIYLPTYNVSSDEIQTDVLGAEERGKKLVQENAAKCFNEIVSFLCFSHKKIR